MRLSRLFAPDLAVIAPLRLALWPDSDIEDLQATMAAQPDYLVLAAFDGAHAIGFAEMSLRRDYVNGCDTSPTAFLEGIQVDPAHRRRGVARALVEEAARCARAQGLTEFASDALLDNEASHAFHQALGFEETERVVYFRRRIGTDA